MSSQKKFFFKKQLCHFIENIINRKIKSLSPFSPASCSLLTKLLLQPLLFYSSVHRRIDNHLTHIRNSYTFSHWFHLEVLVIFLKLCSEIWKELERDYIQGITLNHIVPQPQLGNPLNKWRNHRSALGFLRKKLFLH